MVLYCLFNPLRLDANIALRGGRGAVLQKPLHKGNIVTVTMFSKMDLLRVEGSITVFK